MKSALFLKTKHIGDSIILTSAISALPNDYLVDVVCFPDSVQIFEMNPRVRKIIIIARNLRGFKRFKQDFLNLSYLLSQDYELLAQFSDDWRGAFISRLVKAKISVAISSNKRPWIWKNSFTYSAKRVLITKRSAAESDVDLLRKVHLYNQPFAPAYQLRTFQSDQAFVKSWLRLDKNYKDSKLVIIHPGSRWKFKEMPASTWIAIINKLYANGFYVVISSAQEDINANSEIIRLSNKQPRITHGFDLKKIAALAELADLVISIDSMIIHLASAFLTPVIAIFGPTDERIWAPWITKYKIVALDSTSPSFHCRPCGHDGCAGSKISQCLIAVKPSHVISAVSKFFKLSN